MLHLMLKFCFDERLILAISTKSVQDLKLKLKEEIGNEVVLLKMKRVKRKNIKLKTFEFRKAHLKTVVTLKRNT